MEIIGIIITILTFTGINVYYLKNLLKIGYNLLFFKIFDNI